MGGRSWSTEEDDFLRKNGPYDTCHSIGEQLGRSVRSVQHRFGYLGIEKEGYKIGDIVEYITIEDIKLENYGKQNKRFAYYKCKCGNKGRCLLTAIIQRKQKSCGCLRAKLASERMKEYNKDGHGLSDHRLYRIWANMKNRCLNSNVKCYKDYGGRGEKICDKWKNDFKSFYDWAMKNGYKENLSIDRIDVNGNYQPDNCRWATSKEQADNRRNSIKKEMTAFGETKTLHEWSIDDRCMVNVHSLVYRVGAGWEPERAITQKSERKSIRDGKYSLGLCRFVKKNYPDILEEFIKKKK